MKKIRSFLLTIAAAATLMAQGCASPARGPYEAAESGSRDSLLAQSLTERAAAMMGGRPEEAERLLREALTADLFYGPAHNDLGVLKLDAGDYYAAAAEFEWARKLLPGHPDPRMNLGLTLERAGRIDDAMASYDAALEAYPGHLPTMQALARLQLRHHRADARTRPMLQEIALGGETEQWRVWAQRQLIALASP